MKLKLNESPKIYLTWTDDAVQLLLESVRNFKTQKLCGSTTLFAPINFCFFLKLVFFIKCKIISLFLSSARLWHIITFNILICNCTAENARRNCLPKSMNILITIHYYVFPCYKVRVYSFSYITYES